MNRSRQGNPVADARLGNHAALLALVATLAAVLGCTTAGPASPLGSGASAGASGASPSGAESTSVASASGVASASRPPPAVITLSVSPGYTSLPSASSGAYASASASGGVGTITLADRGRTFDLSVGQQFVLSLGDDFDWTITSLDQTIVERVRNITPLRGSQGVFRAIAKGTTTLAATGDPPCRKVTPPCGAPSILFEVTLVVR